jgi:hypothetical protein
MIFDEMIFDYVVFDAATLALLSSIAMQAIPGAQLGTQTIPADEMSRLGPSVVSVLVGTTPRAEIA